MKVSLGDAMAWVVQKVQINFVIAVMVWVSMPLISVLTTQTAFTDWQNMIHKSLSPSQNFGAKAKTTTKVTLNETSIQVGNG